MSRSLRQRGTLATGVSVPLWMPGESVQKGTVRLTVSGAPVRRITAGLTRPSYDATEEAAWEIASLPIGNSLAASQFPKWSVALNKAQAHTGSARLLCVGDSTTMGVGASPTAGGVSSYPYVLTTKINAGLASASYTLGIPQQTQDNDARWTASANWTYGDATLPLGFGGFSYYRALTGSTGTLTYAPGNQADTIVVYYNIATGNPTVPVTIDGVAQTAINTGSGTAGITKATFTVTAGTHTIVFGAPTGGTGGNRASIFAVEAYLSTATEVRVGNAGVGSSTTDGWINTGVAGGIYNGAAVIQVYAPDLTVIMLGINDSRALVSTTTVLANLATLVTAAKVSGDVLLMSVVPSKADQPGQLLERSYRDQVRQWAVANGVGFVDYFARHSFDENVAAGWMSGVGTVHMAAAGYADVAQAVYDALVATDS